MGTYDFVILATAVVFVMVSLIIVATKGKRRKRYLKCTQTVVGRIVARDPANDNDTTPRCDYEYSLNGRTYSGRGGIYVMHFNDSVKIRYNPNDPRESCTNYDYFWETGFGEMIAFAIIFVVIAFPRIFVH